MRSPCSEFLFDYCKMCLGDNVLLKVSNGQQGGHGAQVGGAAVSLSPDCPIAPLDSSSPGAPDPMWTSASLSTTSEGPEQKTI